jgi:hypothetical protein
MNQSQGENWKNIKQRFMAKWNAPCAVKKWRLAN